GARGRCRGRLIQERHDLAVGEHLSLWHDTDERTRVDPAQRAQPLLGILAGGEITHVEAMAPPALLPTGVQEESVAQQLRRARLRNGDGHGHGAQANDELPRLGAWCDHVVGPRNLTNRSGPYMRLVV